jgi:regulator of sigma E protease
LVLETTIALVFMFAILVMFHELGHFLTARAVGIRVEVFALGFGPKLLRLFKRGDTEYTLHPLPVGGFVKLAGMEPGEEDIPDGFQAQAPWKRALVIFAGPFASFVLAVLVFLIVGVYFGFPDINKPSNRVGMVQPQTQAAKIDLKAGDRIIEIDGVRITNGRKMTDLIHSKPGQNVRIVVERGGKRTTKTGVPQWNVSYLGASWSFMQRDRARVEGVVPKSAADKAGIKEDDELASINGRAIVGGDEMVDTVKANGSREVTIDLMRDGKLITVTTKPSIAWVRFAGVKWVFPGAYAETGSESVRRGDRLVSIDGSRIETGEQLVAYTAPAPGGEIRFKLRRNETSQEIKVRSTPADGEVGYYNAIGLLGFLPEPALVKAGFSESITRGLTETWQRAVYLVGTLTSSRIKQDVGGPVMIAKVTASSVALGPYWVLTTLAGLSLSLAFINLVPIPAVLDGGHLIMIAVEAVRRKRFTREQMQLAQLVGLAMLAVLIVTVVVADITRLVGGLVPQ